MLDSTSRRALLRAGAALAGGSAAPLLPSAAFARAQQVTPRDGIFDVKAFGAAGLRSQNATGACQAAIDACTAAGGGTVRVPPAAYSVSTIQLKDDVTLHVEAGATIFLSQDDPQFGRGRRAMVFAERASNIGVTGRGTLDGLAHYEFVAMRGVDSEIADEIAIARAAGVDMRRYYRVGVQAYMLILNDCRNVLLQDIAIGHSPLWSVRLNDCDRVHVRGVSIYSNIDITMLPENAVDKRATHALRLEHVRGARIRDLSVRWSEDAPEPAWRSALVVRRVSDFEIAGFAGRQGIRGADHPAVLVDACERGTIRDAGAADGCRRLIHVQGLETRDIAISGSTVTAGTSAVSFEPPAVARAVRVGS